MHFCLVGDLPGMTTTMHVSCVHPNPPYNIHNAIKFEVCSTSSEGMFVKMELESASIRISHTAELVGLNLYTLLCDLNKFF